MNFIVKCELGLFRCNRNFKIFRNTEGSKQINRKKKTHTVVEYKSVVDEKGETKLVALTQAEVIIEKKIRKSKKKETRKVKRKFR